jgi:membrane protein implicated in regulation of membrane protease activity
MPYWLKFTLYLLAANVVVLTLAHWLSEFGPVVNAVFAVVAAVVVITLGRKVLNRDGCERRRLAIRAAKFIT